MNEGRIIFVSAVDPNHGAPHLFMPALWLNYRGYDVTMICHGRGGVASFESPIGKVPARFVGGGRVSLHAGLFTVLLRMRVGDSGGTVYYIHGHTATPSACLALLGVDRRRVIYHTQDYLQPGRHRFWEFFEKRMARRAGWVISNEPNRARHLASQYGLKSVPAVVPTALPAQWPVPSRDRELRNAILARIGREDDGKCRLVIHEGGYAPVRCGRQLVEAFRHLPDDFVLVFTGMDADGEAIAELRRLESEHGLVRRIVVLKPLPFADLLRHTACCDMGILLYPNDGVGNFYQAPGRLTHYLRCGLPVVASNFPGLEVLVRTHSLGVACDPTSAIDIAKAISGLGLRPQAVLAEEGIRLVYLSQNELAYDAHAWRIEEIVEHAGGGRPGQ